MRFTLELGRWYATEFYSDQAGKDIRFYSPIRVDRVVPAREGNRVMELSFYHANYPEGVRDKQYQLQVIERAAHFLLARSFQHKPARLLLIYEISWPWLRKLQDVIGPGELDVQDWLNRNV